MDQLAQIKLLLGLLQKEFQEFKGKVIEELKAHADCINEAANMNANFQKRLSRFEDAILDTMNQAKELNETPNAQLGEGQSGSAATC